ncbi:hypothetical protein ATKI12_5676 [Kitasatospora sp. Ki12]
MARAGDPNDPRGPRDLRDPNCQLSAWTCRGQSCPPPRGLSYDELRIARRTRVR